MDFTSKQIKRLKEYEEGDIVNVSTITYSKMQQFYIDDLDLKKKNKYRSFKATKDSKTKPNRPIFILWNDPNSNFLICTSVTSKKHDFLNFKIDQNSYVNYEILIFNKKRMKIYFDGKVFSKNKGKVEKYLSQLKIQRPQTYTYFLENKLRLIQKIKKTPR